MGAITGFVRLPLGDKVRVLLAAGLLLTTRVGLFVVSFARFRRLLLSAATILALPGSVAPRRVAAAVDAADRTIPGERTCLMRSLAAETIHRSYGHGVTHRIGVDPNASDATSRAVVDGFEAHSWIEFDDEILLGDLEDLSRYHPLPPLEGSEQR